MKINTDGVLLGAMAKGDQPKIILDIGTGTGVIALMLAQRFENAHIDAVEIDQSAAETSNRNFGNSPFAERMQLYTAGFEQFFEVNPEKKYDLIVSNPPFYINSLKPPKAEKELAKHANRSFFEKLINSTSNRLNINGLLWLVLPPDTAELIMQLATKVSLHPQKIIKISSFKDSEPHRLILYFGFKQTSLIIERFVIYNNPKVYSEQYQEILKNFFTIF